MPEVDDIIKDKIKRFANELEKENIRVQKVYLYGSWANKTNKYLSDIDIAVISEDFSGIRFMDYNKFINAILKTDSLIEPVAYRPEDAKEDLFFNQEILKKGIRII
jgi:uncharacterized protein